MLEAFLLCSTIGLLCQSWIVFFGLVFFIFGLYWPIFSKTKNFKGWPGGEKFQQLLVKYWTRIDIWVNWLSAGGHWDYSAAAGVPRICFEHYGATTGRKYVAAAMVYLLKDRAIDGVTGTIIVGSNHGGACIPRGCDLLIGVRVRRPLSEVYPKSS